MISSRSETGNTVRSYPPRLGKGFPAHTSYKVGEYDEEEGRHQAFYSPNKDVTYRNISMKSAEKIRFAQSYKYSSQQRSLLWAGAGLVECGKWGTRSGDVPYRQLLSHLKNTRVWKLMVFRCSYADETGVTMPPGSIPSADRAPNSGVQP